MGKLFGTDGIRGMANRYPITAEMALKTGIAAAEFAKKRGYSSVIIGRDTRISGRMIEAAMCAGIASTGIDALVAGVIPTPGIAFLTSVLPEAGAGVVISASHNPYHDNGIKLFKHGGQKLTDDDENEIEDQILSQGVQPITRTDTEDLPIVGIIRELQDASRRYSEFLVSTFTPECIGKRVLKIVVDCSNGAASKIAPQVFAHSCFKADFIFDSPDGKNINLDCGSQHTGPLSKKVTATSADLGLAFDGDSDRLIAIDEKGQVVTGDMILAICAVHAKKKGLLKNNIVISTVMSNLGLRHAFKANGIEHVMTGVGDREVLKKMDETGSVLGGEDSGHMIFKEFLPTGDGILTALRLMEVVLETGNSLSELASIMTVYPQVLMNVDVDESRPDFMGIKNIADEIHAVEKELDTSGRVLIRYSGTQPLLRVMVEGPDPGQTRDFCRRICRAVELGMPSKQTPLN